MINTQLASLFQMSEMILQSENVPKLTENIFLIFSYHENGCYSVMSNSLGPHGLYSPWFLQASLSLLQGSSLGPPHCRQILYQLSPKGSPRILEWVVYSFSRESSWPRNQTGGSVIAGRFFTYWAIRKAI